MIKITLSGLGETKQYKAWKFPGGELHINFKEIYNLNSTDDITVYSRLNSSDDLILLILAIDTLRKYHSKSPISVYLPYMAYMQADRDFSPSESFSLKTITNILNGLEVEKFILFDSHSDVAPALLKNCRVESNHEYIEYVINEIGNEQNLVLLSPDAGAYKKIFKLASGIDFQGEVATANKSRSISTGNIDSIEISKQDFEAKNVLIVDDICIGGRTFVELAKKLKERNVGNLYLAVSHGIFSNGYDELGQYFTKIFSTNSRKDNYESNLIHTYNIF
jgi:ribose-phosphate pyrophosphokinase